MRKLIVVKHINSIVYLDMGPDINGFGLQCNFMTSFKFCIFMQLTLDYLHKVRFP